MSRPITDTLRGIQGGALSVQAGYDLSKLLEAVMTHGKSGKIVITLTVSKKGSRGVAIKGAYSADIPKAAAAAVDADIFFVNEDFDLSRNDPRQQALELRSVGDTAQTRGDESDEPTKVVREA